MTLDTALGAELLVAALIGCLSLPICYWAFPLGRTLRVLDYPDPVGGRKRHAEVTPLTGGLAVMLPTTVVLATNTEIAMLPSASEFLLIAVGFLLLGFIDDRQHIRPAYRLSGAAILCWIAAYWAPSLEISFLHFSFLGQTLFLDNWSMVFTVLCLVGLQNAVNMADGKNGLVIGLCLIWCVLFLIYAPPPLFPLLTTLIVALAIALVFNLQGKLFLGDAGSYSLSVLMGALGVYVYNVNFTNVPADMVALWFLIPVLDCLRLIISRVLRGRSPFDGDRDHLHHFIAAAVPWRYGLVFYLALVGLPALFAALAPELSLLWMLMAAAVYAIVYTVLSRRLSTSRALV